MSGEFKQSFRKYILCLFFICAGSYLAIRFSLWGIEEIKANHISFAVFCFGFAFFGLLLGFLSIFIFRFNRNAYIKIDNSKIDARFGWGEELHAKLSDIQNAEIIGKHLKLYVDNKIICIYNLVNAKNLCEYILSRITKSDFPVNIENIKLQLHKVKKQYITFLIATIISGAFLFINLGWCFFLTDGKLLSDFSKTDEIIFLAFTFAEIFTLILTFWLANKCGKKLDMFNMLKKMILSALALEHKSDDLDKYSNIIIKKYFDHYIYRIVVYTPKENIYAYMLERFDIKTLSWEYCYESVKGFKILSELYDDLDSSFEDVILED